MSATKLDIKPVCKIVWMSMCDMPWLLRAYASSWGTRSWSPGPSPSMPLAWSWNWVRKAAEFWKRLTLFRTTMQFVKNQPGEPEACLHVWTPVTRYIIRLDVCLQTWNAFSGKKKLAWKSSASWLNQIRKLSETQIRHSNRCALETSGAATPHAFHGRSSNQFSESWTDWKSWNM